MKITAGLWHHIWSISVTMEYLIVLLFLSSLDDAIYINLISLILEVQN